MTEYLTDKQIVIRGVETMTPENLAAAMDHMQPNWAISYADHTDLRDYAQQVIQDGDHKRADIMLRSRVSRRLFEVCRAAVHGGLLAEVR